MNVGNAGMQVRPVRGVLLDAGHTLVFVDPARVLDHLAEQGVSATLEAYARAEREARVTLALALEEGANGMEGQVWRHYFRTILQGCGVGEERLGPVASLLRAAHEARHLWSHVPDGTADALRLLRERGYRLGVVSNADGRVEALLEEAGLTEHLEFVIDSHVFGAEKPDPRIFLEGVRRFGMEPWEVLYVGDLFPVDVLGARRAGLQAVLLDPFDTLAHHRGVDRLPSVRALPDYLGDGLAFRAKATSGPGPSRPDPWPGTAGGPIVES